MFPPATPSVEVVVDDDDNVVARVGTEGGADNPADDDGKYDDDASTFTTSARQTPHSGLMRLPSAFHDDKAGDMTHGRQIFLYLHNQPWHVRPWYHKAWSWIFFNTPTKNKDDDEGQVKDAAAAEAETAIEKEKDDGEREKDDGTFVGVFVGKLLRPSFSRIHIFGILVERVSLPQPKRGKRRKVCSIFVLREMKGVPS